MFQLLLLRDTTNHFESAANLFDFASQLMQRRSFEIIIIRRRRRPLCICALK